MEARVRVLQHIRGLLLAEGLERGADLGVLDGEDGGSTERGIRSARSADELCRSYMLQIKEHHLRLAAGLLRIAGNRRRLAAQLPVYPIRQVGLTEGPRYRAGADMLAIKGHRNLIPSAVRSSLAHEV